MAEKIEIVFVGDDPDDARGPEPQGAPVVESAAQGVPQPAPQPAPYQPPLNPSEPPKREKAETGPTHTEPEKQKRAKEKADESEEKQQQKAREKADQRSLDDSPKSDDFLKLANAITGTIGQYLPIGAAVSAFQQVYSLFQALTPLLKKPSEPGGIEKTEPGEIPPITEPTPKPVEPTAAQGVPQKTEPGEIPPATPPATPPPLPTSAPDGFSNEARPGAPPIQPPPLPKGGGFQPGAPPVQGAVQPPPLPKGFAGAGTGFAAGAPPVASAGAGAAASAGAAETGALATAAGGAAAALGPLAIAAAAVAAGLVLMGTIVKKTFDMFRKNAEDIEDFSGPVAAERAQQDAGRELQRLDRAERTGGVTAQLEASRNRVDNAMYELQTTMLELLATHAPKLEIIADSAAAGVQGIRVTAEVMESIANILNRRWDLAAKNNSDIKDAIRDFTGALVEIVRDDSEEEPVFFSDPFLSQLDAARTRPGPEPGEDGF